MAQLTKIPPPSFDLESPTSINLIESNTTNHQFYRDAMPNSNGARFLDSKNDLNLREQEIKNILGSSYDDDRKDGEMCDMACQTRYVINQFRIFTSLVTSAVFTWLLAPNIIMIDVLIILLYIYYCFPPISGSRCSSRCLRTKSPNRRCRAD